MDKFSGGEIDRVIYIWARYSGKRDSSRDGKHYSKSDIKELIRRLDKFSDDISTFNDGFERVEDESWTYY